MSLFFNNPLITIILVLFIGFVIAQALPANRIELIRLWCLDTSIIALLLGVFSCLAFNQSMVGFQFLFRFEDVVLLNNLTFTVGADGLSMIFLLLSLFVFPVCFVSSWAVSKNSKSFFVYLLAMEILLVLTFTTLDLFYFFVLKAY